MYGPGPYVIGSHFVCVYHRVIDAYLVDREVGTSTMYFALNYSLRPRLRATSCVTRLLNIIGKIKK